MTEVGVVCDAAGTIRRAGLWSRAPGALTREVSGGVLVLPRLASQPLLLAGAGWVVWHLLVDGIGFGQACRRIAEEFEASLEETETQLAILLDQLAALDLVVHRP